MKNTHKLSLALSRQFLPLQAFIESRTLHRWFEKCKCRIDQVFLCIFPISFLPFCSFICEGILEVFLLMFFYPFSPIILGMRRIRTNATWEPLRRHRRQFFFSWWIKKLLLFNLFCIKMKWFLKQKKANEGGIMFHLICVRR